MKLVRCCHWQHYTRGLLTGGGFRVVTHESPWRNNLTLKSAIPLGTYRVHSMFDKEGGVQWIVCNIPGRIAVELDFSPVMREPMGDILICPFPCKSNATEQEDLDRNTLDEFTTLTKGLSAFTLEIQQSLPYAQYIAEYGYASPNRKEE